MNKPAILGGAPVRTTPFARRHPLGQEERRAAERVLDRGELSSFLGAASDLFLGGPEVLALERRWAETYGFRHAVSMNSCTSALMAAVGAACVTPGDEVICPPYTMSASATCALFYGGIPVFADIEEDSLCLSPESVRRCITPRTRAIVVVHLFGRTADVESIMELAEPHGITVIEDCAQAPGVFRNGQAVGGLGHMGCFSLNYHKHIHCGEGGLLVTNDDNLGLRCQLIRNHGENAAQDYGINDLTNAWGANFRLTEIQAAIAESQLGRLPDLLDTRHKLASALTQELIDIEGIVTQPVPEAREHGYYVFSFRYMPKETGLTRSQFVQAVNAEFPNTDDIQSVPLRPGYVQPVYATPFFQAQSATATRVPPFTLARQLNYGPGACPVVERLQAEQLVCSPLVREPLAIDDMQDLATAIKKTMHHAGAIRSALNQPSKDAL